MQYLSSYYWQQKECARTALVLQQLVYGKEEIPVLFACICSGENEDGQTYKIYNQYFAEQLTEWFHGRLHHLVKEVRKNRVDKLFADTERALRKRLERIEREIALQWHQQKATAREEAQEIHRSHVAGLLCVGNCFWVFVGGHMVIQLLNRRLAGAHCGELCADSEEKQGEWRLMSGETEADIALLVMTRDFAECVRKEELKECLLVKELGTQDRCRRRLTEMGEAAVGRGGHRMGAVLVVTKEKEE